MKKKILSLCLVLVLGATAIIGGTLAYFTDVTQTETNVFTSGNVDITLTEPSWVKTEEHNIMPGASFAKDPTITNVGSEDCYVFLDLTMNKYKSLIPIMAMNAVANGVLTQDEFNKYVYEDTFYTGVFLDDYMKNDMATLRTILDDWFVGITHADWAIVDFGYDAARDDIDGKGDWMTLRLAYIGGEDGVLPAGEAVKFMEKFTMPATVTEKMIDNGYTANTFYEGNEFEIDFTAYAIQAQEVNGVDAAYAAYFQN